jgi:uncharacterized protein YndB with AHSA1/START domain
VIAFETDVHIARPLEEVFAYVSEPLNFPDWNSAVQTVRRTSAGDTRVGSTYLMERELPTGHAVNELEVVAREWPSEFAIRTTAADEGEGGTGAGVDGAGGPLKSISALSCLCCGKAFALAAAGTAGSFRRLPAGYLRDAALS